MQLSVKIIGVFFLIGFSASAVLSQEHYASFCQDATTICDPFGTLGSPLPGFNRIEMQDTNQYEQTRVDSLYDTFQGALGSGKCGSSNFSLQNPHFFKFSAGSRAGTIVMNVYACSPVGSAGSNVAGIQIALIESCGTPRVVNCESGESAGLEGTGVKLDFSGLTIGEDYYLLIDGFGGSACTLEFKRIEGFDVQTSAPATSIALVGSNTNKVCSSSPFNLMINSNNAAVSKTEWRIIDSSNQEIFIGESETDEITASVDLPGNYTVFGKLTSDCFDTPEVSFDLIVEPNQDEILAPFSFCGNSFPFINHPDPRISDPIQISNIINDTLNVLISNQGCSYTLRVPLVESGTFNKTEIDRVFCGPGPHVHDGIPYFASVRGIDSTIIGGAAGGCDSLLSININVIDIQGMIEQTSCNQLTFVPSSFPTSNEADNIEYIWTNAASEVLDVENDINSLTLQESNTVFLELIVTKDGQKCTFNFGPKNIVIEQNEFNLTCDSDMESVRLSWNQLFQGATYQIFIDDNLADETQDLSFVHENLQQNESHSYRVAVRISTTCVFNSETIQCSTDNCISEEDINLRINHTDAVFCLTDDPVSIELSGMTDIELENAVQTWLVNGQALSDNIFDPMLYSAGSYNVQLEYSDGMCKYLSEIAVFEILDFSEFDISLPSTACRAETVRLSYNGPLSDQLTYNLVAEGNPEITGSLPGEVSFIWNSNGKYIVNLQIVDNGCISEILSTEIEIEELSQVSFIQVNANSQSIIFNWEPVSCAATYGVLINGVLTEELTATSYTYIPMDGLDTIDFAIDILESSCSCTMMSSTIQGGINNCPIIRIDIEKPPAICFEDRLDVIALDYDIKGIEMEGEISWSGTGVNQNGEFDPNVAGLGSHVVYIHYTELDCDFIDSVEIDIVDFPQGIFDIIDPNCPGELGRLVLSSLIDTEDVFVNDQPIVDLVTEFRGGNYQIEFINEYGCKVTDGFSLDEMPEIETRLVGLENIDEGNKANYILEIDDFGIDIDAITWSYNDETLCENCTGSFDLSPKLSGELCATVLFNEECMVQSCLDIIVQKESKYYIPNTIKLNAAEPNNRFRIFINDPEITLEEITIYDRAGSKMYTESGLNSSEDYRGWDGYKNGKVLNPGVFVYLVKIRLRDGEIRTLMGDITLLW